MIPINDDVSISESEIGFAASRSSGRPERQQGGDPGHPALRPRGMLPLSLLRRSVLERTGREHLRAA
jgi:hypothetical protein